MDDLRDRLTKGDLVQDVRRLISAGAQDHGQWLRENLRFALANRRQDAVAVSALTGLAPGTVRGFLKGRPSSIDNVLLMAEAIGSSLASLDQPPEEFRRRFRYRPDEVEGTVLGATLLAFDRSPAAMAIGLIDGTIIKVNHALLDLLGYEEGELIGATAREFSASTDEVVAQRQDEMAASDSIHGRLTNLRRKDGSLVSAITSALVIRDDAGEPRYVIIRASRADESADIPDESAVAEVASPPAEDAA